MGRVYEQPSGEKTGKEGVLCQENYKSAMPDARGWTRVRRKRAALAGGVGKEKRKRRGGNKSLERRRR